MKPGINSQYPLNIGVIHINPPAIIAVKKFSSKWRAPASSEKIMPSRFALRFDINHTVINAVMNTVKQIRKIIQNVEIFASRIGMAILPIIGSIRP